MYATLNAGTRVRNKDGRCGTVWDYSGDSWQTAPIEFDDDRGCVVGKLKTDLTVIKDAVPTTNASLISLALELEGSAQFENSSSGLRDTMVDVADKIRNLAATKVL